MLRGDVVDCLAQVDWLISVFAPEFEEKLGEAEGSAQVVKLRRTDFVDFLKKRLADSLTTEVVIDSKS